MFKSLASSVLSLALPLFLLASDELSAQVVGESKGPKEEAKSHSRRQPQSTLNLIYTQKEQSFRQALLRAETELQLSQVESDANKEAQYAAQYALENLLFLNCLTQKEIFSSLYATEPVQAKLALDPARAILDRSGSAEECRTLKKTVAKLDSISPALACVDSGFFSAICRNSLEGVPVVPPKDSPSEIKLSIELQSGIREFESTLVAPPVAKREPYIYGRKKEAVKNEPKDNAALETERFHRSEVFYKNLLSETCRTGDLKSLDFLSADEIAKRTPTAEDNTNSRDELLDLLKSRLSKMEAEGAPPASTEENAGQISETAEILAALSANSPTPSQDASPTPNARSANQDRIRVRVLPVQCLALIDHVQQALPGSHLPPCKKYGEFSPKCHEALNTSVKRFSRQREPRKEGDQLSTF